MSKNSNKTPPSIDITSQSLVPRSKLSSPLEEYEANYLERVKHTLGQHLARASALETHYSEALGVQVKLGYTIEQVAIGERNPLPMGVYVGEGTHDDDWDRKTWLMVDGTRPTCVLQIFGFHALDRFLETSATPGDLIGIVFAGHETIGVLPNGAEKKVKRALIYVLDVPDAEQSETIKAARKLALGAAQRLVIESVKKA